MGRTASELAACSIPSLDDAIRSWLRAGTFAELARAASRVQSVAAAELPLIPLVVPNDIWAYDRRIEGYHPLRGGLYPFYQDVRSITPDRDGR